MTASTATNPWRLPFARYPSPLRPERAANVGEEKAYLFEGPTGHMHLRDLFGCHHQLIVYNFMFDPSWDDGCKSCSHFMDNSEGSTVHLTARDTSLMVVSRAP